MSIQTVDLKGEREGKWKSESIREKEISSKTEGTESDEKTRAQEVRILTKNKFGYALTKNDRETKTQKQEKIN